MKALPTSRFGRSMLATTCLTLGSGSSALATTAYVESVSAPGGDFPSTALGTLLPAGTTQVNGSLNPSVGDFDDWFTLQGLPGGAFTFTFILPGGFVGYQIYDGNAASPNPGTLLTSGCGECPVVNPQTVFPVEGRLVVHVFGEEGGSYSLISGVPEPSTAIPVGLALAGALAWRRKRKQ